MNVAIRVEDLSKAYQIGQIGTGTISQDLERWWTTRVRRKADPFLKVGETNDRTKKSESRVVWSLRDINLKIEQGDAIGIIGRNGAGKSTLLKILSRVTQPTTGSVKIRGRVASLLEVGTGFHPELTGRENIYLNGSILGMRKKEMDRKLDEIVDFSGIERYIDTPVKRYSSGMSVRLAFAIAAHLESEILIVDEVLAVGDIEFQKKCIGKMEEVGRKDDRTILFVSHNMSAVHALCERGILIESGQLVFDGKVSECISRYSKQNNVQDGSRSGGNYLVPIDISGVKINSETEPVVRPDQPLEITANLTARGSVNPVVILLIYDAEGRQILNNGIFSKELVLPSLFGCQKLTVSLPALWLRPGIYSVYFKVKIPDFSQPAKCESERIMLEVNGTAGRFDRGMLLPQLAWEIGRSKEDIELTFATEAR